MAAAELTAVRAAARTAPSAGDRQSTAGRDMLHALLALPPEIRRDVIGGLPRPDLVVLLAVSEQEMGTRFGLWQDDLVGFIEQVIGDNLWSRPREIIGMIPTTPRIAVPSAFSTSKTFSLSRVALAWANVWPVGTAKVVTLAPQWRQVSGLMWPEIRRAHARAGLPGEAQNVALKMVTADGTPLDVAVGFVGNTRNEASVQGHHAPHLLLIVDEAGGIPHRVGKNLRAMLTGEDTHIICIGNPPSDDEGSWFETFAARDDVVTMPISAYHTPNLTGETAPRCRACPPETTPHSLAKHLINREDVDSAIADFGADSPWVKAKIHATFPRGGGARAIPMTWLDMATDTGWDPDPADPGTLPDPTTADSYVHLGSLGLPDEVDDLWVRRGAQVSLGVDVASDGGDEFVICRLVDDVVTERLARSGEANANAVDVAGEVLLEIRRAVAVAEAIGSTTPVRVKVDAIGVGWGVTSTLQAWASEQVHPAEIVGVVVSESPNRAPDQDPSTMRPYRKRDEMWLAGRQLLQPVAAGQPGRLRLRVSRKTHSQLGGPTYGTTSSSFTQIESKASMRKRGLPSPDRAEAVLLAVYEPGPSQRRKKARLIGKGWDAAQ